MLKDRFLITIDEKDFIRLLKGERVQKLDKHTQISHNKNLLERVEKVFIRVVFKFVPKIFYVIPEHVFEHVFIDDANVKYETVKAFRRRMRLRSYVDFNPTYVYDKQTVRDGFHVVSPNMYWAHFSDYTMKVMPLEVLWRYNKNLETDTLVTTALTSDWFDPIVIASTKQLPDVEEGLRLEKIQNIEVEKFNQKLDENGAINIICRDSRGNFLSTAVASKMHYWCSHINDNPKRK